MADLKRDMAILATSGRDWAERTKCLAARVPGLDIFSQALVERRNGGWRITEEGRAVLEFMEVRPRDPEQASEEGSAGPPLSSVPLRLPAQRNGRRRELRQRRRAARERTTANAS
nr:MULTISPECIES: hypothetical protein [unclassified Bradyrhizobium]